MSGPTTTFGKTGRIVTYTVPVTGLYDIEAIGASGGAGINKGGLAADVGGDVKLTAGEVLSIAVGGTGGLGANGGGGGGGSFVVAPGNVPLVIAGGGGGGNSISRMATVTAVTASHHEQRRRRRQQRREPRISGGRRRRIARGRFAWRDRWRLVLRPWCRRRHIR